MKICTTILLSAIVGLASSIAQAVEIPANDYPTYARADYVFACMQVNGQSREALEKCACSIDAIAAILPYKQYEEADVIMAMRQRGGDNSIMFRDHPPMMEKVNNLKRAQAEGELRCF